MIIGLRNRPMLLNSIFCEGESRESICLALGWAFKQSTFIHAAPACNTSQQKPCKRYRADLVFGLSFCHKKACIATKPSPSF